MRKNLIALATFATFAAVADKASGGTTTKDTPEVIEETVAQPDNRDQYTAKAAKNKIKHSSAAKSGVVHVLIGERLYALPEFQCRLEFDEKTKQGYLSFGTFSEVVAVGDDDALGKVADDVNVTDMVYNVLPDALKKKAPKEMPELPIEISEAHKQIQEALKALPEGFKMGYSADGSPKLVRARKRNPAAA